MRRIFIGECDPSRNFTLVDPDGPSEAEFEATVAKALCCAYPDFQCVVFGGRFLLDGRIQKPDLALVARDYSHWFVIEVELASHSFEGHVFPQVRTFRYGEAQPDCEMILSRELRISPQRARTLVREIPRSVAVIANRNDQRWRDTLRLSDIQLLVVSVYQGAKGERAVEVDGVLSALDVSLGFGRYSAIDRSLRFPKSFRLPEGSLQVCDYDGTPSTWTIRRDEDSAWLTKDVGTPDLDNGKVIQIIRTMDGRFLLRRPEA